MKTLAKKKYIKQIALTLSLVALVVWVVLGTGASLAWFTDTSPELNNIFHFADFDLEVSHRLDDGTWEKVDSETKVFDDEALYEPGYVQVVYLKAENKGEAPFELKTAVHVTEKTRAINVFGVSFDLQDYLRFGLVTAETEAAMDDAVSVREKAVEIADSKLLNYYETPEKTVLQPGEITYITLIVRMPEDVGNVANYRGETVPKVELGVIVQADQLRS